MRASSKIKEKLQLKQDVTSKEVTVTDLHSCGFFSLPIYTYTRHSHAT